MTIFYFLRGSFKKKSTEVPGLQSMANEILPILTKIF